MIESTILGQDVKRYWRAKITHVDRSKYEKINFFLVCWKWNLIMNPTYSDSKMTSFIEICPKIQNFIIRDNSLEFAKKYWPISILNHCKYFILLRGNNYNNPNANKAPKDKKFLSAISKKWLISYNSTKILKQATSSKYLNFQKKILYWTFYCHNMYFTWY